MLEKTIKFTKGDFKAITFGLQGESNKPFIKIQMHYKEITIKQLNLIKIKCENWDTDISFISPDNNQTAQLQVKGKISVIITIQHLQQLFSSSPQSKDFNQYSDAFLKAILATSRKPLVKPIKNANKQDYVEVKVTKTSSANPTHEIKLFRKNNSTKHFIFKEDMPFYLANHALAGGKILELEPFFAQLYKIFMSQNRVPTMKVVFENEKRIGVISKLIPNFISAKEYLKIKMKTVSNTNPVESVIAQTKKEMIAAGMIKALVASYILSESDFNVNNWGFDEQGKIVRIDFDRSFWQETAKYRGFPPYYSRFIQDTQYAQPKKSFPITTDDLLNFPKLKDAVPSRWFGGTQLTSKKTNGPTNDANKFFKFGESFAFQSDHEFCQLKWKEFLKATLLHENDCFTAIANDFLGSENAKKKYVTLVNSRLSSLKENLIKINEFQLFIKQHPSVFNEMLEEMRESNQQVKDNNKHLRINCEQVEKNYQLLLNEIMPTVNNAQQNMDYLAQHCSALHEEIEKGKKECRN